MTNKSQPAIGIIGKPGSWSTDQIKVELQNAYSNQIQIDVFSIQDLRYVLSENEIYVQNTPLSSYSAIIIKKLGKYSPKILDWLDLFEQIEAKGVRFFSSPGKIRKMISRIACTSSLAAGGIHMPETVITENVDEAIQWLEQVESAVFKPNFSTKATGMTVLNSENADSLHELKRKYDVLYLQEKLDLPGRDHGIAFCNGQFIGAYSRVAGKGSWNTTTKDGGYYAEYIPSKEVLEIASQAQAVFGLDFCSVDVAESNKGLIVFEVSAFGGFSGLQACGVNGPNELVKFIKSELK